MPSTASRLFEAASLKPQGIVAWGRPIPVAEPGVYLVSLSDNPDSAEGTLDSAPLNNQAIAELLRERPELTVDGFQGAPGILAERVAEFWLPDESILYVGLAGTSLAARVGAYYRTKLGRRSPHAGGWFTKLLDNLPDLHVHYATAGDPDQAEDRMLSAFVAGVSAETRSGLRDPGHPFPFANLEWPKGVRKNHGIRGATGSPSTSPPVSSPTSPRSAAVGDSEQNFPRPPQSGTDVKAINAYLQAELRRRERDEVAAVEAAKWLDRAGILTDSTIRAGLPLRDLLRAGVIDGQRQEPNRRWYIDRI